jgi:hypothetical protein
MKQKNENILAFLARMGLILITAGQRPAENKCSQLCPKGRTFSAVLSCLSGSYDRVFCPQVAAFSLPAVMKIWLFKPLYSLNMCFFSLFIFPHNLQYNQNLKPYLITFNISRKLINV